MNPFPMPLATSGSPMLFGRLPTPAKGGLGRRKYPGFRHPFGFQFYNFGVGCVYAIHIFVHLGAEGNDGYNKPTILVVSGDAQSHALVDLDSIFKAAIILLT